MTTPATPGDARPATDERLAALLLADARRLRRRRGGATEEELVAAEARLAARRALVPTISYPDLPVTAARDELLAAIDGHQVVIVAGETGSGKSTQLPKLCLELGRGVRGLIGHTQPRRLAARTVAERIAVELGSEVGGAVGYAVRFTDHVGPSTLLKVMTDGILLAELQRDRELSAYDTIIVDEAHERSLNIDFLLGYLRQLLPRRPDLKVVVTSATIDTARFSEHFGGAPVIEVSGRGFPVEVRYRPLVDEGVDEGYEDDEEPTLVERDQTQGVIEAVRELQADTDGDLLVFLSGEREIRDTAEALTKLGLRNTEILPLYARLSASDQHRVFEPGRLRRVVLATNVAETSLTVPRITGVVDAGNARISRYNRRTKVQRLPIEAISQASANQRSGRCGRIAPGVAIRLYSEEDFEQRPAFTEPEVLRTNIASVILQMAAIGLGDIAAFPFVEVPDTRSIGDGVDLLTELGAFKQDGRLTGRLVDSRSVATHAAASTTPVPASTPASPPLRLTDQLVDSRSAATHAAASTTPVPASTPASPPLRLTDQLVDSRSVATHAAASTTPVPASTPASPPLRLTDQLVDSRSVATPAAASTTPVPASTPASPPLRLTDQLVDSRSVATHAAASTTPVPASTPASPPLRLTAIGKRLARLPVDPRLGRMVLEAERLGCTREVMVLAAALSIQDPRERPQGKEAQAAQSHARFKDADSDFTTLLNLWGYLEEQQKALSSSAFRRMCKAEYLHFLRVREWRDVCTQLRQVARTLDLPVNKEAADPDLVHRALLAGLLSQAGVWDQERGEYQGARQARFTLSPGSVLNRKKATWVMAAELVETNRLWGHKAARIKPEWLEELGAHLVKRSHGDPWWDAKRGSALTKERVTLYGLPVVTGRTVQYGSVNPTAARDLFIDHALLQGDWDGNHPFVAENKRRVAAVAALEDRVRRRHLLVGDDVLFAFFDERVGDDVVSVGHFNRWWKQVRRRQPGLLTYPYAVLVDPDVGDVGLAAFPDSVAVGDLTVPLRYRFAPGEADDGITAVIPVGVLNRVTPAGFDWLVPGLRRELATVWIRTLPKAVRKELGPAPDLVATFPLDRQAGPFTAALARHLGPVAAGVRFDPDVLPDHLRMAFEVVDDAGRSLGWSKDLGALQRSLAPRIRSALAAAAPELARTGLVAWTIGTLPRTVENGSLIGHPALVDEAGNVSVQVLDSEAAQRRAMWLGTRRLLLHVLPSPAKTVDRLLTTAERLALAHSPYGTYRRLVDDATIAAVDSLLAAAGGPVWDEAAFDALVATIRTDLVDVTLEIVQAAAAILGPWHDIERRLAPMLSPAMRPAVEDMQAQLDRLLVPRFLSKTGRRHLPDVVRYVEAISRRVDKLATDPARDRTRMVEVRALEEQYERAARRPAPGTAVALSDVRWLLEELRVSLFAQDVGTPTKVSPDRIRRELARLAV